MEVELISEENMHIWLFYLVYYLIAYNTKISPQTERWVMKHAIADMNLSENTKKSLNEYLDRTGGGFLTKTEFYLNEKHYIDSLFELPIDIFQKIVGGPYAGSYLYYGVRTDTMVTYQTRPECTFSPKNNSYQNRHLVFFDIMISDDTDFNRNQFHSFSNKQKVQVANALLMTASKYECNRIVQSIIQAKIAHFMDMDDSIGVFKKFDIVGYLANNRFKNANKYIWYRRKNFAVFNKALITSVKSIQQQNRLREFPIFPLKFGTLTIIMVNGRFVRHLATFM